MAADIDPSLLNRTMFIDETTIQTHGLKELHQSSQGVSSRRWATFRISSQISQAKLSEPYVRVCEALVGGVPTKGNVDDDPKPGRPPKIPDIKAREAAEIICRGYLYDTPCINRL
jgi:hypothetical protein